MLTPHLFFVLIPCYMYYIFQTWYMEFSHYFHSIKPYHVSVLYCCCCFLYILYQLSLTIQQYYFETTERYINTKRVFPLLNNVVSESGKLNIVFILPSANISFLVLNIVLEHKFHQLIIIIRWRLKTTTIS